MNPDGLWYTFPMKYGLLAVLLLLLPFAACDQKPRNPVAEHGDAMINAYERSKVLRDSASLSSIQTAVRTFHAEKGRYPSELAEIRELLGSDVDFSVYDYNPENGSVTLKSQ